MPDLPNSFTASVVFSMPSGILAKTSASCFMAPSAVVAVMPAFLSASPCSMRLPARPLMPLASDSMVVPDWLAASSYLARSLTAMPTRWDRSFIASAASIARFATDTNPATDKPPSKPAASPPSAALAVSTDFDISDIAPPTERFASSMSFCRRAMFASSCISKVPAITICSPVLRLLRARFGQTLQSFPVPKV